MIVSAVTDPTAFGRQSITDIPSKREAIGFLKAVIENGVLLDGPTYPLIRLAIEEASQLATDLGQRVLILLEEIRKAARKFIATCDRVSWETTPSATELEKCCHLAALMKADAIITQPAHGADMRKSAPAGTEVVILADVSESQFEQTRQRLSRIDEPLDRLPREIIDELVGRAVKYAPLIRVFDYRMAAGDGRAPRYREGIQFIAMIWKHWCVAGNATSRGVELYTVAARAMSGFLTAHDAHDRLERLIQSPLQLALSCTVSRFVKQDREPAIFHARGFEAKGRAFTLDPGFDALGPAGPLRRCLLKAELSAEKHFDECRRLKDLT